MCELDEAYIRRHTHTIGEAPPPVSANRPNDHGRGWRFGDEGTATAPARLLMAFITKRVLKLIQPPPPPPLLNMGARTHTHTHNLLKINHRILSALLLTGLWGREEVISSYVLLFSSREGKGRLCE